MRKPTTPSTMLITKVGVSASLDKEDTLSKNSVISTYICCINFNLVRLKYSPVKLLSGVKTMVTSHVMLPQACCCWGGKCHFVDFVLFPFYRKNRSMKSFPFPKKDNLQNQCESSVSFETATETIQLHGTDTIQSKLMRLLEMITPASFAEIKSQ